MGDVAPQEGNGVRQIRETSQVTDFRWLFPSLPIKTAARQDMDICGVFGPFWTQKGAPGVTDG